MGEALAGQGEWVSSDWSAMVSIWLPGWSELFDLLTNFACYLISTIPGLAGGALDRLVGEIKHGNENKLEKNDVRYSICTN